ncbi:Nn.00g027820.m01.CDS01 [Neocucurbitaria sp. VM-36]
MLTTTTFSIFSLLATLVLALSIPRTGIFAAPGHLDKLVKLHIYSTPDCTGGHHDLDLENHTCAALGNNAGSLRVVYHGDELRYNSLHVYAALECDSGPILEPLTGGCSAVVAYKSVRVDGPGEEDVGGDEGGMGA